MNLSTLSPTNIGSDALSALGQVSAKVGQPRLPSVRHDSSEISSFSVIAGNLQDLHRTSSADYRVATSRIANRLQNAAQNSAAVDANQTGVLNNLAAHFRSAATTGQLPNWPELANALAGPGRVSATPQATYETADHTAGSGLAALVLGAIQPVVG